MVVVRKLYLAILGHRPRFTAVKLESEDSAFTPKNNYLFNNINNKNKY